MGHSQASGGGVIMATKARKNGLALVPGHRAIPNKSLISAITLGIVKTKKDKHASAVGKLIYHQDRYFACKARREKKGKPAYPDVGASGLSSCKVEYNKWQKYRGKAGEKASKLASKLEAKGKLDPGLKKALDQDMAKAGMLSAQRGYAGAKSLTKAEEFVPATDEEMLSEEEQEAVAAGEEAGINPLLVAGGILLAGGAAYLLFFRKPARA